MIATLISIALCTVAIAPEQWANTVTPEDGMSYFKVAEDLSAKETLSNDDRRLITELYVLAAVANPVYRDSAILGIIYIIQDEDLILQLQNLRVSIPTLVPNAVQSTHSYMLKDQDAIKEVCSVLTIVRQGKIISQEQSQQLNPWKFMFPATFDSLFTGLQKRRKALSNEAIESTLKVELTVLGGSSLWSSDYISTGSNPVTVNMSDDLATLLSVNPANSRRVNNRWMPK